MVAATNFYKFRALKTAQIYSVTILEVRSPKVVSLDSSPDVNNDGFFRLLGNNLLIYLFHLLETPVFLGLQPLPPSSECTSPTSASILTLSSLTLPASPFS